MVGNKKIMGHCLCQTIAFEIQPPTKWCSHCHCHQCREAHGAAVVTWVGVDEKNFGFTRGEAQLNWFESTPGARRGFCRNCGSTLFFQAQRWPGEMHISRAAIPGPIDRKPAGHFWYDRRIDWMDYKDDLPHFGGESGVEPLD